MKYILPFKPFCRFTSARRFSFPSRPLRALPLLLLNGALMQVAHAQSSGAQAAQPSALYSLVSTLSVFAFLALLVGAVRPKTFAFLFKKKATGVRGVRRGLVFPCRPERPVAPQAGRNRNHADYRGAKRVAKRARKVL